MRFEHAYSGAVREERTLPDAAHSTIVEPEFLVVRRLELCFVALVTGSSNEEENVMRLSRVVIVVAVLSLSVLAGCGDDDSSSGSANTGTSAAAEQSKPAKVALLHYAYVDFNQAEEQGVKSVVEGAGGSVEFFNANFDPQKQMKQCNDAITSGRFNVIMLVPVDSPLGIPCVQAAKAANIPVIAFEVGIGKDRTTVDPQLAGVVGSVVSIRDEVVADQMKLLKAACEGIDPCKVIVEISRPGDPITGAYVTAAKKVPNVEVVATVAGMYDPGVIAKAMPDVLSAHPDANVFLAAADSQATAVLPILKEAGLEGKITLIGNGGSRLGKQAIEAGTIFGTSGTYPQSYGKVAGEMAIKAANGEPIEPAGVNARTVKQPNVITKDNVDQFEPEWGAESAG